MLLFYFLYCENIFIFIEFQLKTWRCRFFLQMSTGFELQRPRGLTDSGCGFPVLAPQPCWQQMGKKKRSLMSSLVTTSWLKSMLPIPFKIYWHTLYNRTLWSLWLDTRHSHSHWPRPTSLVWMMFMWRLIWYCVGFSCPVTDHKADQRALLQAVKTKQRGPKTQ